MAINKTIKKFLSTWFHVLFILGLVVISSASYMTGIDKGLETHDSGSLSVSRGVI